MPSRSERLDAALGKFAELRALYAQLGVKASKDAERILADLAREITNIVGQSTNAVGAAVSTDGQLTQLLADLDAALDASRKQAEALFGATYNAAADLTLKEMPAAYLSFGRSTSDRLRNARAAFTREARGRLAQARFTEWTDRFNDATGKLRSSMRSVMIQSQLEGWDQRTVAKQLLRIPEFQWKNLPPVSERAERIFTLGGTLDPSDALVRRANMIARTETKAITERLHQTSATAAGIERFINVNSDPVAVECMEANEQGAMTLEEWDAWTASNGRGGRPPRHPNCDSSLYGVPPGYESEAEERQRQMVEDTERREALNNPEPVGARS